MVLGTKRIIYLLCRITNNGKTSIKTIRTQYLEYKDSKDSTLQPAVLLCLSKTSLAFHIYNNLENHWRKKSQSGVIKSTPTVVIETLMGLPPLNIYVRDQASFRLRRWNLRKTGRIGHCSGSHDVWLYFKRLNQTHQHVVDNPKGDIFIFTDRSKIKEGNGAEVFFF